MSTDTSPFTLKTLAIEPLTPKKANDLLRRIAPFFNQQFEGSSEDGQVTIVLTGDNKLISLQIDPRGLSRRQTRRWEKRIGEALRSCLLQSVPQTKEIVNRVAQEAATAVLDMVGQLLAERGIDPGSAPQVKDQLVRMAYDLAYSRTDAVAVCEAAVHATCMEDLVPVLNEIQARYDQPPTGGT
jgi:DNA-binding protein YbaB